MPPVYIKPLLPVKLNCNPSELYFTRLIWCFTKYRYWMRWGQLIVHTTTGTGAGSQCRRYNRPPGPFTFSSPGFIPYTEMLSFGTSLHQRTLIWYFINVGGRTRSIKKFKPKLLLLLTHFKTCSVTYQLVHNTTQLLLQKPIQWGVSHLHSNNRFVVRAWNYHPINSSAGLSRFRFRIQPSREDLHLES